MNVCKLFILYRIKSTYCIKSFNKRTIPVKNPPISPAFQIQKCKLSKNALIICIFPINHHIITKRHTNLFLFQKTLQQFLGIYHYDTNIVPQKMQNATKASWHSARSFYCTLLCKFICFCTFRSIIVLEYLCVAILLLIWNTFVFFVPLLPWNALMLSFFYCSRNAFVLLDSYVF